MSVVIITGCSGFIAGYVAKEFFNKNWRVIGVGHRSMDEIESKQKGFEHCYSADISVGSLGAINIIPDVIVHCAGSGTVGFSMKSPFEDFRMASVSIAAVCEFARAFAPNARIVYLSSAAVYGDSVLLPIKETAEIAPRSPYGVHKWIGEELCQSYSRHFGLSISIIRLFSIYGPGLKKQLLWDACRKLKCEDNSFFGTGEETRDWLHVKDAAHLIYVVAENTGKKLSVFNGGTGRQVKNRDVLELIAERLGQQSEIIFNGVVKPGDPVNYCADITNALSIGWRPEWIVEDGVVEYVNWFRGVN